MSRSYGLNADATAYVRAANREEPPALLRCREETAALGGSAVMQISPEQGAFLQMLVRMIGARDAIELGVFTGYSATAVALAMRDRHHGEARLIACDVSEEHMARAVLTFEAAGVADVVEPRIGPGLKSLDDLIAAGEAERFDFAFIDADKPGYSDYYDRLMTLLRPGGVMAFDNVLWSGAVFDPAKADPDTVALRAVAEKAKADDRVDVAFTTIGDGLLICQKR